MSLKYIRYLLGKQHDAASDPSWATTFWVYAWLLGIVSQNMGHSFPIIQGDAYNY